MALSRIDTTNMIEDVPQSKLDNNINFRNILINGDMSIAQRGTSATGLGNGDNGYHTCDRWRFGEAGAVTYVFTQTQSTDVPTGQGFAKSLKMDCTTAQGSLASADGLRIQQRIEGQNLQYIKKGTSNAESLTLSFWVKSNKTGTYTLEIADADNSRFNSKTYTISSANTWEKKTITYDGDTTGTLDNDNAYSFVLHWWLGAGTDFTSGTFSNGTWGTNVDANRCSSSNVNLADNTANEWYITGIQLEAGQTASEFEFLPYDVNLERCYRYYQVVANGDNYGITAGGAYNTLKAYGVFQFKKEMRASPTIDQVSGTNYFSFFNNGVSDNFDSFQTSIAEKQSIRFNNLQNVTLTAGHGGWFESNNAAAFLAFDAEL